MSTNASPFIEIVQTGVSKTGRTKVFEVRNTTRTDDVPGSIIWHGPWRGYVYQCDQDTIYDSKCLKQIADFIEAANAEQKTLGKEQVWAT